MDNKEVNVNGNALSNFMVRYLGGDLTLIDELRANRSRRDGAGAGGVEKLYDIFTIAKMHPDVKVRRMYMDSSDRVKRAIGLRVSYIFRYVHKKRLDIGSVAEYPTDAYPEDFVPRIGKILGAEYRKRVSMGYC